MIHKGPSPFCGLDIRHSLGRLVESPLSNDIWRLASLGVSVGSIGDRSAVEHAPAACPSSLAQSQELCTQIWSGFDEYDIDGGLQRSDTDSSLLSSFLQRRYLRVLQHSLAEKPVGHDRCKSLPQLVRSVITGAPPPDTCLPQPDPWSWRLAPCPP